MFLCVCRYTSEYMYMCRYAAMYASIPSSLEGATIDTPLLYALANHFSPIFITTECSCNKLSSVSVLMRRQDKIVVCWFRLELVASGGIITWK